MSMGWHYVLNSGYQRAYEGGNKHLWNVDILLGDYTAKYPRRLSYSYTTPWEPEISQKLYFIFYPCGVCAQSDPCTAIISFLLCVPIQFIIIPDSSTRALWQLPAATSTSEAGQTLRRNGRWICPWSISHGSQNVLTCLAFRALWIAFSTHIGSPENH
jgi:hypothetical protein